MLKLPNVAQQNWLFLNKGILLGWLWSTYSNTYVSRSYLKIICQRQTIWGSEVRHINRHEDYCEALMTYAASIHLTLEVFLGKWVVSELNLHFTPGLQSSVRILPSVCILRPGCSLRFTLTAIMVNFVSFSDSGSNTSVMLSSIRVLWRKFLLIYCMSFWKCLLKNDKYKFFCCWPLM